MTDVVTLPAPVNAPAPAPAPPASPRARVLHIRMDVREFFLTHATAAIFPFTAGLILYGWRALALSALVVGSTFAGLLVWRRVGWRGSVIRMSYGLWSAGLLALTLPAHLAAVSSQQPGGGGGPPWAVLAGGGLALSALLWLVGPAGASRLHPVLLAHLLLVILFGDLLVPSRVLQRNHLVVGDLLDSPLTPAPLPGKEPWAVATLSTRHSGVSVVPASGQLREFTTGQAEPGEAGFITLDEVIRDRLPPLEDLIVGAQPGPVGAASAVAVIMGGLFLLYRGLIDYRIPLLIVLAAFAALLVLPIPVVITDGAPQWRWIAFRQPSIGWSWAITFANYELMAGPLLFVACFLATAPGVRPMTRRARTIYAVCVGVVAAMLQLYLSISFGPYLALLAVGLMAPLLDRWFKPRPLV